MKTLANILLLIVALSTITYGQTKAKAQSEEVVVQIGFVGYGGQTLLKQLNKIGVTEGTQIGSYCTHCTQEEFTALKKQQGGPTFSYKVSILTVKPFYTVLKANINYDEYKINRRITLKRNEVVNIAFRNGIKIKAYFESAKDIIESEENINAENR